MSKNIFWALTIIIILFSGSSLFTAYADEQIEDPMCKLSDLPPNVKVYAVGAYKGLKDTDIILDSESGHNARSVDIIVNKPGESIVLVLMAYDSVVWKVKRTINSKIMGVIIGGYHKQALLGIPHSTPAIFAVYKDKESCPYFYAYKADEKLDPAIMKIKKMTGKDLDHLFIKSFHGKFYIGPHEGLSKDDLLFSNDRKIEDYTNEARFPSGEKGLNYLVSKGAIRPAMQKDIDAWVEKASQKYQKYNKDIKVEHYMYLDRTYVVLKQTRLPNDLYGAHSRSFIIPKGVPMPGGSRGHNSFYFMDTGSCNGTDPNCRRK